jgi:Tol biopolymer transport system component
VVRVSPPNGRTDVALGIRPAVVFSEPLDGTTLRAGIQLVAGNIPADGELSLTPGKPWVADLVPASPLIPSTTYRLSITREVRDLAGEALDDLVTVTFTTVAAPPPPEPPPAPAGTERIAFTSTRDGASAIYLANTDGSGVVRLASGRAPKWSPDGSRLAFFRDSDGGPLISVINADGSGESLLGPGFEPNWSPDGTRIAFWDYSGIWVMNADGSGKTLLLGPVCLVPGYDGCSVSSPSWSPDGQSIAFTLMSYEQCGVGCGWPAEVSWLGVMGADGTNRRPLYIQFASGESASLNWARPIWSPDGSRIAWATWYANESLQVSRYAVVSVSPSGADFQVDYLAPQGWAAHAAAPDWSPDGRAMLFEIYEFVSGGVELSGPTRIFVTEGETDRQLIPGVAAPANPDYRDFDPAWSRVTE